MSLSNLATANLVHATSGNNGEVGFSVTYSKDRLLVGVAIATGTEQASEIDAGELANGISTSVPNFVATMWVLDNTGLGPGTVTHADANGSIGQSGVKTGLAPGIYTLYAAYEDQDSPFGSGLIHITFEIEDQSASGSAAEIVDANGGSATSDSVTFSLTTEADDNAAVIVIAAADLNNGYPLRGHTSPQDASNAVTFNGVAVPFAYMLAGFNYPNDTYLGVYILTDPPIGTYNVVIRSDQGDSEATSGVAIALKRYEDNRGIDTAAVTGELCLRFGGRVGSSNLTIGSPWERDAFATGSSGQMAVAVASAVAEDDEVVSGSWTPTGGGGTTYNAFLAIEGVAAAGAAPAGNVTFDAAVGYNAVALRNVAYDGEDGAAESDGFHYEYDVDAGAATDYDPDAAITGLTPSSTVSVRMRAVNSVGAGDWSAAQVFRLHEDWHRPGIIRQNRLSWMNDQQFVEANGPFDAGSGRDALLLIHADADYGGAVPANNAPVDVEYDSVAIPKLHEEILVGDPPIKNEGGGLQAYATVLGDAPGSNNLAFEQTEAATAPITFTPMIAAFSNVDQSDPFGFRDHNILAAGGTKPLTRTFAGVKASMDELIVLVATMYATLGDDIESISAPSGWTTTQGTLSTDTQRDVNNPETTGVALWWRQGWGRETVGAAYYMGVHTSPLLHLDVEDTDSENTYAQSMFAIRPSPNMLHTLAVGTVTESGAAWTCQSDVNHGRVLVALTAASDPAPTAQQIRDEIDETSEDDPYSGTFVSTDTLDLTAAGSNGDTLAATITPETEHRLSVVYESWQRNLGGPLVQTFNLVAEPPTLTSTKTYPNAVFPQHDGNSTTEARVNGGTPVTIGESGGIGGLTADTTYDDPGLQLRQSGGEWSEPVPFSTREAVGPITVHLDSTQIGAPD